MAVTPLLAIGEVGQTLRGSETTPSRTMLGSARGRRVAGPVPRSKHVRGAFRKPEEKDELIRQTFGRYCGCDASLRLW